MRTAFALLWPTLTLVRRNSRFPAVIEKIPRQVAAVAAATAATFQPVAGSRGSALIIHELSRRRHCSGSSSNSNISSSNNSETAAT